MGNQVRIRGWSLSQVMRGARVVLGDEVVPRRSGLAIPHQDRHCDATRLLLELAGTDGSVQQVSLSLVFVATVLEPDLHLG